MNIIEAEETSCLKPKRYNNNQAAALKPGHIEQANKQGVKIGGQCFATWAIYVGQSSRSENETEI